MNEIATLNNLVTEIKFFESQAVTSYWEIGKRLSQAKEQVGHGSWESWLKDNLNYSQNMAGKLIRICQTIPKSDLNQNLNFTQVYALTTVDEEIRNEILTNENLEDKSVKETKEIIKKYKEDNAVLEATLKIYADNASEFEEKAMDLENENRLLKMDLEKKNEPEIIEKTVTKEVIKEVIPNDYETIKRENKILQDKNKKLELEYKVSKLNDNEETEKLKSELRNYKWLVINFVKNTTPLLNLIDQIKLLPKEEQELLMKSTENLLGFANNLYEQMKGL